MRVNLKCPFSEKDQAKALGAKWDASEKTWFVIDPPDMRPFMRWLGGKWHDAPAQTTEARTAKKQLRNGHRPAGHNNGFATIGRGYVEDLTEYHVPPWEDVDDWQAIKALREACA
jgi:hypothetical protein